MPHQMSRRPSLAATWTLPLLLLVSLPFAASAGPRPAPLMDFVPQEAGIYDTYHTSLNEQDCRGCHGQSTEERHHWSQAAQSANCTLCHEYDQDGHATYYTNCILSQCHNPSDGSPHHLCDQALAMECTRCHNPQLLGQFATAPDPAQPAPQVGVPTPYSCQNCHWPQQRSALLPSTDQHYGPDGTLRANEYFDLPGFSLQPLELADEPGDNGWLYPKSLTGSQGNHHVGGLFRECASCHAYEDGYPGADPNEPLLIRYCERCHSPESLHAIRAHVEGEDSYVIPGLGWNAAGWEAAELSSSPDAIIYRPFSQEERCAGCHTTAPADPPPSADDPAPFLHSLWPSDGEPGQVITVSGSGFGQTFSPGSRIQISATQAADQWLDLPPVTWTPTQIAARVPASILPVGNHYVRLLTPAGTSNEAVFTLTDHCCPLTDVGDEMDPGGLDGDTHTYGPLYSKVTLQGPYVGPEAAAPLSTAPDSAGVNYFTQILVESSTDGHTLIVADPDLRRTTPPNPCASLSGTVPPVVWRYESVTFRLQKFWEDANGNYACDGEKGSEENVAVPVSTIPPGAYLLKLRRIYWKDWNGNGIFDQPNPLEASDPANEAFLVTSSGPVNLIIDTSPYVRKIKPRPVLAGSKVRLVGINFGEAQGDSTINIYKRDAQTLKNRLTAESRRMRRWRSSRVVFRMPGKPGQVRWLSVTVGGEESNRIRVKLY